MKIKLHWKLTFIFCSAVVLGLFIGYFYLSTHLKTHLENNLENNLKRQLSLAKDFLETYLNERGAVADTDMFADRIGKELAVRATIITQEGVVIGDTDLNKDEIKGVENHIDRPEVQEAIKKGFGMSKRFSSTIKKHLLYMAVPFGEGKVSGFIRLAIPLSEIELQFTFQY